MGECPSRYSQSIIFSVSDQYESGDMINISLVFYIYMSGNLEESGATGELSNLSVMSEEHGCHVNMFYYRRR